MTIREIMARQKVTLNQMNLQVCINRQQISQAVCNTVVIQHLTVKKVVMTRRMNLNQVTMVPTQRVIILNQRVMILNQLVMILNQ